jgi:septum site-determining protein MinC
MNTESLALDFKSATLYAVRVVLHSADTGQLAAALDKRMADAGSFFENEPVVIDASRVDSPVDWPVLLDALRAHNLPPIGVVAEGGNLQAARAAGLVPVELSAPPTRSAPVDAGNTPPPLPTQPAAALTAAPAPQPGADETSASREAGDAAAPRAADDKGKSNESKAGEGKTEAGASGANGAGGASGVSGANEAGGAGSAGSANGSQAAGDAPASPNGASETQGVTEGRSREPLPAREARETTSSPAHTPAYPQSSSALVISRPLRSGQRVYARHTDLVVIGMVSPGAEVIADGNIHVYGPLRGKAMAGARGDTSARIFTTHLDAELLAVAGVYRVVEQKLDATLHGQPALVRLDGDTLRIEALKA